MRGSMSLAAVALAAVVLPVVAAGRTATGEARLVQRGSVVAVGLLGGGTVGLRVRGADSVERTYVLDALTVVDVSAPGLGPGDRVGVYATATGRVTRVQERRPRPGRQPTDLPDSARPWLSSLPPATGSPS